MEARPPRLARTLVRLLAAREARDPILGDLEEDFHDQIAAGARAATARRRYWRQALASLYAVWHERLAPAPDVASGQPAAVSWRLMLGFLLQDARHGVRLIARAPGFATAAILTLSLGLGANTAIFTVAWQAMLRPLPYPDAHRLVTVWETSLRTGNTNTVMPANFRDWERAMAFDAIAAYGAFGGTLDLTGRGEPEQWRSRNVTARYFDVFGMPALVGRTLGSADTARLTVVISEGTWRRRFGADRSIAGREIVLNGQSAVIAGVMPAAFDEAGGRVDAWVAFDLPPELPGRRLAAHYLGVVARLRPGVSLAQADSEVKGIAAHAADRYPRENGGLSTVVISMDTLRGEGVRPGLTMLALSAIAVLLVACANLASLQMSRSAARLREFGIRASLGATRRRLIIQLLTEGLVLAMVGAVAGLLVGRWLLAALSTLAPAAIAPAVAAGPDVMVIAFTFVLALASALVFALWPAWRAGTGAAFWFGSRVDTGDRRSHAIRASLVTLQITFATVLLISAATLTWSLRNVLAVDPGFTPEGVLAFDASLSPARYDTAVRRRDALERILAEVRSVPDVTAACGINELPFNPQGGMTYVPEHQDRPVYAAPRTVTPGCFELLRIELLRGRLFDGRERSRAAIVNERFARTAWPEQEPIGKRVHVGVKEGPLVEVVGVVADTRHQSLAERPQPVLYEVAVEDAAFPPSRVLARTTVAPEAIFAAVRAAVRRADADQPVANLRTLESLRATSVAGRRFDLTVVSAFSGLAVLLVAVGIYGLLAHIVAQRSAEIGIRLALGATPASVVRLVMRTAWVSVIVGGAAGLGGALAAARLLRRFVFGVSPTEPALYACAVITLAALVLIAAWIPARRAAQVDPAGAVKR